MATPFWIRSLFTHDVSRKQARKLKTKPTARRLDPTELEDRSVPATMYAVDNANNLLAFDSATPGTIASSVPITTLGGGEFILGIDVRPATGGLYGLGVTDDGATRTGRVYTINPATGAAAPVGAAFGSGLADTDFWGVDFNPNVDLIRITNSADQNLRVNPNTGLLVNADSLLTPAGQVVHDGAYTNSAGAAATTTLYALSSATNSLVTIGGLNGTPSPNGGAVLPVGPLGIVNTDAYTFDIEAGPNAGRLTAQVGGSTNLYTVDLGTGAATLVGAVAGNPLLRGLTSAQTAVTVGGTAGNDTVVVTAVGANSGTYSLNGGPAVAFSGASSFAFLGGAGDDKLTLDYTGGSLPAVTYHGGPAGNDALRVVGSGLTTTYTPSQTTSGNGTLAVGGNGSVSFTGLEPIDYDVTGGTFVLNTGAGTADVLTVENGTLIDGITPAVKVGGTVNGVAIENARVRNSTVSVLTNDGTDSVTVTGVNGTTTGVTAVSLNAGQTGGDAISVTGPVSVTGAVSATAGQISVTGAVSGANVTLDADGGSQLAGSFIGVDVAANVTGTGTVTVEGRGGDTGSGNYGVLVQNGADLSGATTTVTGTGGAGVGSFNYGVLVASPGSAITSAGGGVTVAGQGGGGVGGGSDNYGVYVLSGGQITAGGTGAVGVTGTGGAGTGNNHFGVHVDDSTSRITSANGNVTVVGTGGGTGTSGGNYGVYVFSGGQITAGGSGAVGVTGTGGATAGIANFGVYVLGTGSAITSGGGGVAVGGQGGGGAGAGRDNYGVYVLNGGQITSAGTGAVGVTGTGGAGSGNSNYGVYVTGTNSKVTSGGGGVTVGGQGGGGAGAGGGNYGVLVQNGGQITAAGGGAVGVTGTGGAGSGTNNIGVFVPSGGQITAAGSGAVGVTGTGGAGSGDSNRGVFVLGTGAITSGGGGVTVAGQGGGGAGSDNYGVMLDSGGQITAAGGGAVGVTGTGGAGSGSSNYGLYVVGTNAKVSSAGGNVTATGFGGGGAGSGTNNFGVYVVSGGQITAAGGGAVGVTGTGGAGSGGGNHGVLVDGGGQITAGGAASSVGVTGTGQFGVYVSASGSRITSAGGAVTVMGTGAAGGNQRYGVAVDNRGQITAGGTGAVSVTGLGGSGTNDNRGVYVHDANGAGTFASITGAGAVTVNGTGGTAGTSNPGVTLTGNGVISSTGTLSVTGNKGAGTAAGIQIDTGTFGSTGLATLSSTSSNITVAAAAAANFGSLTVTTTGAVTVTEDSATELAGSSTAGSLALTSGGAITQSGPVSVGGLATVSAGANDITLTNTGNALGSVNVTGASVSLTDNSGFVITGASVSTLLTLSSASLILQSGAITGTGGLTQAGTGVTGLSQANTYTGATTVNAGRLSVDGSITSNVTVAGGILSGTGTVNSGKTVTVNSGGTVAPGDSPGVLNTGSVTFSSGSTLNAEVNGNVPGTGHDQLNVTGTVALGGATLATSGTVTSVPNQVIVLIANDGTDAVTGTFAGLAEGAAVSINGVPFVLSYQGGSGNDVTLTQAGNFTFTVPTNGAADNYTLRRSGTLVQLLDGGGTILDSRPFSTVSSYTVQGENGQNDQLTVDFSGGNPIPAGGVSFNGGTAGNDTLVLGSGTTTSQTFNFVNENSGSVVLAGAIAGTVSYTGLEPVTSGITATDVVLNYSNTAETITVSANGAQTQVDSDVGGEVVSFNNPTGTFQINAGDGADAAGDVITFNGFGPGLNAALTVNGKGGTDTVNFNATGLTAPSLTASAETIQQTQGVTVSGLATFAAGTGSVTLTNAGNSLNQLTVTAGSATVTDSAGGLVLAGANSVTGTYALTTVGGLTQTAAVTAGSLSVSNSVAGAILLATSGNPVGTFAASNTADGGAATMKFAAGGVVGTVGSVVGITTASGTVTVSTAAAGIVQVNSPITTVGGGVNVSAGPAGSSLSLGANIDTTGGANAGAVVLASANAATLTNTVTINTDNAAGTDGLVQLTNAINAQAGQSFSLTITAGAGNVSLSNVGATTALAGLSVTGGTVVVGSIGTGSGGIGLIGSAGVILAGANVRSDVNPGAGTNGATAGAININGNVTLSANVTIDSDATTTDASISIAGTVNATTAGSQSLTLTAGTGSIGVTGSVGGTTRPSSLTTSTGTGLTTLDGTVFQTTGGQTLGTPVSVTAAGTTFDSSISGNIAFNGTLNGASAVTVNTAGTTTFGGAVGGTTPLTSLTTNATGSTVISGGAVTTTGAQAYNDNVTVSTTAATLTTTNSNVSFAGTTTLTTGLSVSDGTGNTTFTGAVNGPGALSVTSTGTTTFSAAVGTTTALASVSVSGGTTAINGGAVTTTGTQSYNNVSVGTTTTLTTTNSAVTINGTTTLAGDLTVSAGSGNVTFTGTVEGGFALAVNSSGSTIFTSQVGNTTPLASVTTNAGGMTAVNGGLVRTTGLQTYGDPVSVGANAIFLSSGTGNITFSDTLNGAFIVIVSTGGNATFTGAVGGTIPLSALSATAVDVNAAAIATVNGAVVSNTGTASTVTGVISGPGSAVLQKNGAGTLTLTGNSTYGGATSVNAGVLLVNGNNSGAAGAVTVSDGAVLGGSGSAGGAVANSGTVAPGATFNPTSTAILTVASADLAAATGDTYQVQLNGTTAGGGSSGYDRLTATGAADVTGARLNIANVGYTPAVNDRFDIVTAGSPVVGEFTSVSGFGNVAVTAVPGYGTPGQNGSVFDVPVMGGGTVRMILLYNFGGNNVVLFRYDLVQLQSIVRNTLNPTDASVQFLTNRNQVTYRVTFNQPIQGLSGSNFTPEMAAGPWGSTIMGLSMGTAVAVNGSDVPLIPGTPSRFWTVTLNTGMGNGQAWMELTDPGTPPFLPGVTDTVGIPVVYDDAQDEVVGVYEAQRYDVDKVAPRVAAFQLLYGTGGPTDSTIGNRRAVDINSSRSQATGLSGSTPFQSTLPWQIVGARAVFTENVTGQGTANPAGLGVTLSGSPAGILPAGFTVGSPTGYNLPLTVSTTSVLTLPQLADPTTYNGAVVRPGTNYLYQAAGANAGVASGVQFADGPFEALVWNWAGTPISIAQALFNIGTLRDPAGNVVQASDVSAPVAGPNSNGLGAATVGGRIAQPVPSVGGVAPYTVNTSYIVPIVFGDVTGDRRVDSIDITYTANVVAVGGGQVTSSNLNATASQYDVYRATGQAIGTRNGEDQRYFDVDGSGGGIGAITMMDRTMVISRSGTGIAGFLVGPPIVPPPG